MSHAAVVKDGLLCFVTLLTVLLVLFVYVTVRTSPEVARPPTQPDAEPPPVPARPDLDDPTLGWPPRRASWPGEAADQPAGAGPVVRRATRGGPPWGPAPRPPGLSP
jgi:hypothetical protein